MNRYDLIVVTPVYEDVEASSRLFQELAREFGEKLYIVAVDDGSVRQPLSIDSIEQASAAGVVIKLRRNVGHQRAIAIGLAYVAEHIQSHQRVVVMDSDGEDLPSSLPPLLEALQSEHCDVVVAERKSRVETLRFKIFYVIYKWVFGLMTGRAIGFGNFMALKPFAVKRLVAMQELAIHVAASLLASKVRIHSCPLDRGPRYAGQSKMNFASLVLHGFKALMVFAEDVLVRVGIVCTVIAGSALSAVILAITLKLVGLSSPGWFSTVLGILVLMFLQTGALALMTLMLTGVVRSGTVTTPVFFSEAIDRVLKAKTPSFKSETVKPERQTEAPNIDKI